MGQFLGSMVGAGAGLIANAQTNEANVGLQNAAENYNANMLEEAPSLERQGLLNAGLNPILAAGGGFSASTPQAPIIPAQNAASAVSSGANVGGNAGAALQTAAAQVENTKSNTSLMNAQTDKAGYDAMGSFTDNKVKTGSADASIRVANADADAAEARAKVANALATTASNQQVIEKNFPVLSGMADAVFGRMGNFANTGKSLIQLGTAAGF